MIPTLIVLGLALGRWWRSTLLVGLVGWPLLLLGDHLLESFAEAAEAAGLGLLNIGAGVLVHQALLALIRLIRRRRRRDRAAAAADQAAADRAAAGQAVAEAGEAADEAAIDQAAAAEPAAEAEHVGRPPALDRHPSARRPARVDPRADADLRSRADQPG